jgi:serine/threonine-protein kinase RsbW
VTRDRRRVRVHQSHFELSPDPAAGEARCAAWLEHVEALAVRIAGGAGLDEDGAYYLGVAVREALTNAITHGRNHRRRVAVSFRMVEGPALVITVRDRGPAFDPKTLQDPLLPENLEKGSGRGLFYMRRFVDEVRFAFPTRGGTVARLLKRLPSAPA